MGSPISVVIDLTKQILENKVLLEPPCQPLFWKRYVDDIITAIPTTQIKNFTNHLNSQNENIKFTAEIEEDKHIPLLDLLPLHMDDGSINFEVYRKPTHSGKYLDFKSYNPVAHKNSVMSTLFFRSKEIWNPESEKVEDDEIRKQLKENNYRINLINKLYRKINNTILY